MDEDTALQYYYRLQLENNLSNDDQLGGFSSADVGDDEADGNVGAEMEAAPANLYWKSQLSTPTSCLQNTGGQALIPLSDQQPTATRNSGSALSGNWQTSCMILLCRSTSNSELLWITSCRRLQSPTCQCIMVQGGIADNAFSTIMLSARL